MLKLGRIIVMVLWALGGFSAFAAAPPAESPFIISKWGAASGPVQKKLPSSVVISALQTRDGYLWLGTLNGLVRFDGDRFTVFDESTTPGLPSNPMVFLYEDRRGWLWVGTDGGGVVLIREGQVATLGFGLGSSGGKVMAACEDAEGGVWFYTADGQLGRFFGDGLGVIGQGQPSLCRALIADGAGRIWVGADSGQIALAKAVATNGTGFNAVVELKANKLDFLLASRDGGFWRMADGRIEKWATNRLQHVVAEYPWTNVPNARITSGCEDAAGNLVVGVLNAGVYWFEGSGQFTRVSPDNGLSHAGVLTVCSDREGNLWVGTDGGGLNRLKRRMSDIALQTQGRVVQSVCEDSEGALWVGFTAGGVMRLKDGVARDFGWDWDRSTFRPEDGLVSPNVLSVFADRSGQVWVGTRAPGGLHQFRDGRFELVEVAGSLEQGISAMHQDRSGRIWVGTPNGLACWDGREWKVLTTRDGLSTNAVRAIADDEGGSVWIGTEGGGLNQWSAGKITVFRKADGLPGDRVTSLLVDDAATLWVGTGSGLGRLKDGRWSRFTTAAGLPSNSLNYLVDDEAGFLWIGSNAGLIRVAKDSLAEAAQRAGAVVASRTFDESDGLPTSECTAGSQPAAIRTRAGKLWFPTIGGLVGVELARLQRNTNPPPVMIESVQLDGREQLTNGLRGALPSEVVVPPGAERLGILFASLNLAAPERALFRYQLEGHETHWSPPSTHREAIFPKLPPGRYRFHVMACNEDGVWNQAGAVLAVRVLPPFWRTWWFMTLGVLAVLGVVAGTVHFISTQKLQRQLAQLKQKESLERERSRIARDLHDQLGANLTRVSLLGELVESDKNEPAEVEQHARQISKTAGETQRALDEIVWAANPANDTLEGLVNYLCKYAQEFLTTAGLRCRLDVPAQLPATPIAPEFRHNVFLVAKEAVNNVVKHAQATSVRVQIKLESGALVMEVEDDGRGPDGAATASERGRNGLRNMSRRMEDVGGSFSIGPAATKGTLIQLRAPLQNFK